MIFRSETHLPSSVKLWQIPQPEALPMPPVILEREVPLEAQDTSYFADSARIFSFSRTFSFIIIFRSDNCKNRERLCFYVEIVP